MIGNGIKKILLNQRKENFIMNQTINIRIATVADAKEILAIYTPYILKTSITFEYDVPSLTEFEERITNTLIKYPYLVALLENKIVGYAYASSFKSRAAYNWSVETSIYIDETKKGMGIGKLLYQELEQILQKQNICNLCSCITYPNPQSIGFHANFGYKKVALFTKSGYKFNEWHDMVWMEKFINEHDASPSPFIPFSILDHTLS